MVDEGSPVYEGWRVAAASAVGLFFASLIVYGFGVLLKPLAGEFAWSREATAAAYSSFALGSALAAPVIGRFLDRHGPAPVVVPCLACSGAAIASLSLLSGSRIQFYVVFFLLGLAAVGTSPLAYSRAISTWFDRRRGAALAIVLAGGAAASIIHPPTITALIGVMDWRRACLVLGGVVLAIGVPIVTVWVREKHAPARSTSRSGDGVAARAALRSWIFWVLLIVVAIAAIAFNAIVVHLVALLTDRGATPAHAAMTLSCLGGAGLLGRLATGWLIDRFRASYVSAALLALAAGGILLLATASSEAETLLSVAMIGFGMGGELDVTPFLLSRYFGLRSLSTLYGFSWTAMGGGAAGGSVLMGRAFDAARSYDGILFQLAAATAVAAGLMLTLPVYRVLKTEQPVSGALHR